MNRTAVMLLASMPLLFSRSLSGAETNSDSERLISWLLQDGRELRSVPFAEVVKATCGKKIVPFNPTNQVDRQLLAKIGGALDAVLQRMNASDCPAQKQKRINEVSAYFEKATLESLNQVHGFQCEFPKTAAGKIQHSGYPDLRLFDQASHRVVYLDPKLYEQGSRASSFRTFYFEPKKDTNKILDDAHHLIVGFEREAQKDGKWKFLSWELVDLAQFHVRLKAEFQGSNRDLYRPEAIVGSSRADTHSPGQ